jgi:enhanced filamentous growth protein 1
VSGEFIEWLIAHLTEIRRIPFDRALDFANREKITDILYPLFVHNIGGLLYNPENAPRTNAVVAATTERRRMDSIDGGRPPSSGGSAPSLHHHHSMSGSMPSQAPPTPHSLAANGTGRPGIDRAHTFPTPPTSASSVMGMGSTGSSYEWGPQHMANGVNGAQPLSIDTGINARSMPTTPATTPPTQTQANMQGYQGQAGYDSKPPYNTTPGSASGYPPHQDARYGHPSGYTKSEMGPPTVPSAPLESHDASHGSEHHEGSHAENGYPSAYGAPRAYSYNPTTEHHLSPEVTGSPHQTVSGRGTPRTMAPTQAGWPGQDYRTPPRGNSSSNVYNVVGNGASSNGPSSDGNYPSSAYSGGGMKRGREDDDQDRPDSRDYDYKRQKTGPMRQESFGMALNAPPHMQAIKTGGGQR